MRLHKKISYEYFVENVVLKRKLYTSGKVVYNAAFKTRDNIYTDTASFFMNEPEDLSYYDAFARVQLTKKLLAQVNKGV